MRNERGRDKKGWEWEKGGREGAVLLIKVVQFIQIFRKNGPQLV